MNNTEPHPVYTIRKKTLLLSSSQEIKKNNGFFSVRKTNLNFLKMIKPHFWELLIGEMQSLAK